MLGPRLGDSRVGREDSERAAGSDCKSWVSSHVRKERVGEGGNGTSCGGTAEDKGKRDGTGLRFCGVMLFRLVAFGFSGVGGDSSMTEPVSSGGMTRFYSNNEYGHKAVQRQRT